MSAVSRHSECRHYLDHAATTPLRPEVLELLRASFGAEQGNPGSVHAEGRAARERLESARDGVRRALDAASFDVVFTASGTESCNLALVGSVLALGDVPARVTASAVEHSAVLETRALVERLGAEWRTVPVESSGHLDVDALRRLEWRPGDVVSIQAVNNETGVRQPVEELARELRPSGVRTHSDIVQALGRVALSLDHTAIDLASLSGHKVGAPQGVGALLIRRGVEVSAMLGGGGQELGLRPGTQGVALAEALALSLEIGRGELDAERRRIRELRELLEQRLLDRIEDVRVQSPDLRVSDGEERGVAGILLLSFAGLEGASLVRRLDKLGIAASTGSACHAEREQPSHVLRAMGRSREDLRGSLRLSLGSTNRVEDVVDIVDRVADAVRSLRELAGYRPRALGKGASEL